MDDKEIYKTICWARFIVRSTNAICQGESDILANQMFDPDEVSRMLHTKPMWTCRCGDSKGFASNPDSVYDFTAWFSKNVTEPPYNRQDLCRIIVQRLKPYANELIDFRNKYNASYEILLSIYTSGSDVVLDLDTIAFFNSVGITITINTCLLDYKPECEE